MGFLSKLEGAAVKDFEGEISYDVLKTLENLLVYSTSSEDHNYLLGRFRELSDEQLSKIETKIKEQKFKAFTDAFKKMKKKAQRRIPWF